MLVYFGLALLQNVFFDKKMFMPSHRFCFTKGGCFTKTYLNGFSCRACPYSRYRDSGNNLPFSSITFSETGVCLRIEDHPKGFSGG